LRESWNASTPMSIVLVLEEKAEDDDEE